MPPKAGFCRFGSQVVSGQGDIFTDILRGECQDGRYAALKYVPNPMDAYDCREIGSAEDAFYQSRYAVSKREAEIMNRFRGESCVVQYLEEPEYLQRMFVNGEGKNVMQYAVLICMPLYKNSWEWLPQIKGNREKKLQLGIEIAHALELFEEKGVYHRDIKPGNIMMDDEGHFRLGDVGEAKLESEQTTVGFHGTRAYMAPEVYNLEKERGEDEERPQVGHLLAGDRAVPAV